MPYADPDRQRQAMRDWSRKRARMIDALKSGPCVDCGVSYPPYVMQFDHTGNDKFKPVSQMTNYSLERVLEEIKKCDLVCANCHAERTHNRAAVEE